MIESRFISEAARNGAFSEDFQSAVDNKWLDYAMHTPTEALVGIAAIMATQRYAGLGQAVLKPFAGTRPASTQEQLLAELAGNVLSPYQSDAAVELWQTREHKNPGVCEDAEPLFAGVLLAKQTGQRHAEEPVGPVLVHRDADRQPVLIEKFYGANSALGLQDISVNGVRYPAGTLYSVHSALGRRFKDAHLKRFEPLGDFTEHNLPTGSISSIAPLRLSLYALPPAERPQYPMTQDDYDNLTPLLQSYIHTAEAASLTDFADTFR